MTSSGGNVTDISPLEARVSQRLNPLEDEIDRMIAKEVSNKMVRDRKIAMQDEIDEHEMKESLKIGAEAAANKLPGRPKLGGTEVLEKLHKLRRDNTTKIDDSIDAIKSEFKSVKEEIIKILLPEDKQGDKQLLLVTAEADVKGVIDELEEMKGASGEACPGGCDQGGQQ